MLDHLTLGRVRELERRVHELEGVMELIGKQLEEVNLRLQQLTHAAQNQTTLLRELEQRLRIY